MEEQLQREREILTKVSSNIEGLFMKKGFYVPRMILRANMNICIISEVTKRKTNIGNEKNRILYATLCNKKV